MSFILDALKKLERNRARRPAPSLDQALPQARPALLWWLRRLPWALLALVLVGVVGVLVWRYITPPLQQKTVATVDRPTERAPLPKTNVSANPPAAITHEPTAVRQAIPPTAAVGSDGENSVATERQIVATDRRAVQPAPRVVAPPTLVPTTDVLPTKRLSTPPRVTVDSRPGRVVEVPPVREKATAQDDDTDRETSSPRLEAEPHDASGESAGSDTADVPLLEQMPPELQTAVPKLKISILAYANTASERMAYINGQKYVEGQLLEGKLKVEAITRGGVVLSYQGQRFLIRP